MNFSSLSFRATLYPCPESPAERREMAIGVMTRIEDLQTVSKNEDDEKEIWNFILTFLSLVIFALH